MFVNNYLSKKAAKLTPYAAGEQPQGANIIKLNTNENPYPPSPKVKEVLSAFDAKSLRLYPRTDGGTLKSAAAQINGLPENHVFCGNGSDEILGFAFYAFFDNEAVFADVTYSFYPVWAALYQIPYKTIPLDGRFNMPVESFIGDGIVIANPNAPTGIALNLNEIEQVLKNNAESVVIVDEAYSMFGAQSAAPLVKKYPNLLVVTTLSKSHGLAGLRAAYALAQPHLIKGLERVKDSFNSYPVDSITQAAAAAALYDTEYCAKTVNKIISTRNFVSNALTRLGFSVLPSCANFLFVTHPFYYANDIKAFLEQNKIYVRHFNKPRIENYLRISIGTDKQMETVLKKLHEYCKI